MPIEHRHAKSGDEIGSRTWHVRPLRTLGPALLLVLGVALTSLLGGTPARAFQRDQIDAGFQVEQLITMGGAGPDPGPGNPRARLEWALATAIPAPWRQAVPVAWSADQVTKGHLALSFFDGTVVVSPRVLRGTSEAVLTTVAHEMGHQIAISLVSANDGLPPRGFIDFPGSSAYRSTVEGWADCVSRVWTGSVLYTQTEAGPCSVKTARYVSSLLANPQNLRAGRLVAPPVPAPLPPAPAPDIQPAPVAESSPVPRQVPTPVKAPEPERQPSGIAPGLLVLGGLLALLGPFGLVILVRKLVPDTDSHSAR